MRRFLTTTVLTLLLTNASTVFADAQNADSGSNNTPLQSSDTSTAPPSSSGSAFKLFAGVTHQELLPQAHESLQPHLDRQAKAPVAPTRPPVVQKPILDPERTVSVPSITQTQKTLVDTVSKPALRAPALNTEKPITQAYEPAFGVARLTADRTAPRALPAQHYTIEWFMIPSWMAGVWLKDGDMTTNVTDLRTGMSSSQNEWTENRMEASWGHLQDAQGNYWHVNLLPSERDGNSAGKLVRFVTVAQKCESSTPQQLMTRTLYVVSESNPWNNQPLDTFQQESLNHYVRGNQNQLLNTSSNRVFTYQGAPVREGHLVSQFAKIRQFTPVATLNGVDLRTSLNDYLQSHALGHLRK